MQANIKFHLLAAHSETLSPDALNKYSAIPLLITKAQRLVVDEGEFITQVARHYLADLNLLEFRLDKARMLYYNITKPTFLLFADLNKNACQLSYRPAGVYQLALVPGKNQMLFISFRPDWLIHKCQHLSALHLFTNYFNNPENQQKDLPVLQIATNLFKCLKKMGRHINDLMIDTEGYLFINHCINKYYHKLIGDNSTSHYYRGKAIVLDAFIKENFASHLVNDLSWMASKFMVSERTLYRLAKAAFGVPLHEQVINTRMAFAYNQLVTTVKPIYEIAYLSGYNEPHYFSKAFKKYFGMTPKEVKRPVKAQNDVGDNTTLISN